MAENLRQAAGSLLVVGLADKELTALERAWLKLLRPAGIILFRRNIADAKQTRALLGEASVFCAAQPAFVDVEGGTVDRLRDRTGSDSFGAGSGNGDAAQPAKQALAREHGELIARAVRAFGFNTSLAPVVDLALPDSVEVLGTRCAGCCRRRM